MHKNIAVEIKNLSKKFGNVIANDNINFIAYFGEVLAILGENGSGKTTLMNMLSGIYKPDEGKVFIKGKNVSITSPANSISLGIGMIHQHFKLVENMTAIENIYLGNSKKLKYDPYKIVDEYKFNIDLNKKIYDMSVSEKQTLEIIKVLSRGVDILILDEPTAVLTPQEVTKLFLILNSMKEKGKSIIIITHKLNEIIEISDRVTILRKGKSIDTIITAKANIEKLTELMVGDSINLHIKKENKSKGNILLDVHKLTVKNESDIYKLNNVSFNIYEAEIVGVAGVAGSGQKELCEAIAGLQKVDGGSILLEDKRIEGLSPKEIINRGVSMSFIPEDRLGMGLVSKMTITENMLLKKYGEYPGIFLNYKNANDITKDIIKKLNISTTSSKTEVRKLSGGNLQKVLLGREISSNPKLLIVAYPVRGLDINSSMLLYDMLMKQRSKGAGILYIGEDLDSLIEISDRILVMYNGKIVKELNPKETTKEEIGLYMTNAKGSENNEK